MTGSSPEVEFNDPVTTETSNPTDANTAEASSSSEGKGAEVSLIDSVKEALSDKEKSPGSGEQDLADPVVPKAEGQKPEAQPAIDDEITEDELKTYGPKTQRRMRQLLGARTELRQQVESLKPKAERVESLDQFLQQNGMTAREHAVMLELGALLVRDPFQARERLTPIIAKLDEIVGNVLPPELEERVSLGYLTREDARRLVKAERRETLTREQTEQQQREREQTEQRRQAEAQVAEAKRVGNEWEATVKAKDPDWPMKQQRFAEKLKIEVYEKGAPSSASAAVEMFNRIYDSVTKEITRFAPRRQEVRHVSADAASSRADAEPKTALEAARLALAR